MLSLGTTSKTEVLQLFSEIHVKLAIENPGSFSKSQKLEKVEFFINVKKWVKYSNLSKKCHKSQEVKFGCHAKQT